MGSGEWRRGSAHAAGGQREGASLLVHVGRLPWALPGSVRDHLLWEVGQEEACSRGRETARQGAAMSKNSRASVSVFNLQP